jgi:hypothetical protein
LLVESDIRLQCNGFPTAQAGEHVGARRGKTTIRWRRILLGVVRQPETGSRRSLSMEGYAVRKPRRQEHARSIHVRRFLLIVFVVRRARPRCEQAPKTPPRDLRRHGAGHSGAG